MTNASPIRHIVRADLPALKQVIASTDLFPPDMLEEMVPDDLDTSSGQALWLTHADPEPLAIAYAAPEPMTQGCWNLYLIAVHGDHHSRGIGQSLLRYVESNLVAEGVRVLLVETSSDAAFARTRGFYAQAGYEEEARVRDFYDAGEDKIIFRKVL
ncbi:MAG: GNAT family N-acetyltransferase [Pseudomonadota bacterium]